MYQILGLCSFYGSGLVKTALDQFSLLLFLLPDDVPYCVKAITCKLNMLDSLLSFSSFISNILT